MVTKQMETIEISDDETDSDEVQIVEVTPSTPSSPPTPQQQPAASRSSDPELEAALAGLDKDTEKQVQSIVQEITKHVESDMWKLAYETANEEKKVNCC